MSAAPLDVPIVAKHKWGVARGLYEPAKSSADGILITKNINIHVDMGFDVGICIGENVGGFVGKFDGWMLESDYDKLPQPVGMKG